MEATNEADRDGKKSSCLTSKLLFSNSEVEETGEINKNLPLALGLEPEMHFGKGVKEELYQQSNVACWELCRGRREGRSPMYLGDHLPSL